MDRISLLENEIAEMRKKLYEKENELYDLKKKLNFPELQPCTVDSCQQQCVTTNKVALGNTLPRWAIERYSRQILLSDIGVDGQAKICCSRVLVVGAGGLGCPVSSYLAGAGVGEIGIVDYDTVDVTNIHRQLLHCEQDQGMSKVESAAHALRRINSHVTITPYNVQLDSKNALEIISKYDLVLDCTDNVPSRYLLNDACALLEVTLISGSALKMEGQLTIYNYRAERNANEKDSTYCGPCYRCLFDTPPPPETVGSCSANGVCGPVPAVIGCLQALEAIKLIVGFTHNNTLVGRMLIFDGEDMSFRVVKLRARDAACAVCSTEPRISQLLDYEAFCNTLAKEKKRKQKLLKNQRRKEAKEKRMTGKSYFGFRKVTMLESTGGTWIQDVPKEGRKLGPPCESNICAKGVTKNCSIFDEEKRNKIFSYFWNELDWKSKKVYVKSLVETIPPKRRRRIHKGEVSRKGDSRRFYLLDGEEKLLVCRVMFLNTLGIREGTLRTWMSSNEKNHENEQKKSKKPPVKSMGVDSYLDNLPKMTPKCHICRNSSTKLYYSCEGIKNQFQLYQKYCTDMSAMGLSPASRKTFAQVFHSKDFSFFKPKSETDVCDLVSQHNLQDGKVSYQVVTNVNLQFDNMSGLSQDLMENISYSNAPW